MAPDGGIHKITDTPPGFPLGRSGSPQHSPSELEIRNRTFSVHATARLDSQALVNAAIVQVKSGRTSKSAKWCFTLNVQPASTMHRVHLGIAAQCCGTPSPCQFPSWNERP